MPRYGYHMAVASDASAGTPLGILERWCTMKLYRWIRDEDGKRRENHALPSSHAGSDKQGYPLWMARGLQVTCNALNKDRPSADFHYVGTQDGTPVDVPMHDLNDTVFTDPTFLAWMRDRGDTTVYYDKQPDGSYARRP